MPPFFSHDNEVRLGEAEVPPATGKIGTGQRIRVGVIERDNGLTTATTSTISNALYDLADTNSTTHTVLLPHGTTVKLGASVSPTGGSWRARFVINNPKLDKTVESKGTSAAADMANQIDLLALGQLDKNALAKVTEAYEAGSEHAVLVAFGLAEAPLEEIQTHVSGYVTKSGKHVGAYSQIRKSIDKIHPGGSVHFPDGIAVRRLGDGKYSVGGTKAPQLGGVSFDSSKGAADRVAEISAGSTRPKSIGGRTAHSIDKPTDINSISNRGDNPNLPGAPHPADVADRAAKARKGAKLPSRKDRAENEQQAGIKQSMAGTNHPNPEDWAEMHDLLVNKNRSLKVDSIRAAKAHALSKGDTKMADRIEQTRRKAEGRSSKSSRLVPEQGSGRDQSPMPGVIRSRNEADAIRAGEHLPGGGKRKPGATDARHLSDDEYIANFKTMHGRAPSKAELTRLRKSGDRREREGKRGRSSTKPGSPAGSGLVAQGQSLDGLAAYKVGNGTPGSGRQVTPSGLPLPPKASNSGRRGGKGSVDDPNGSKIRAASSDPGTFATEAKGWSTDELRREAKVLPNSSPLYKLLVAELRRKTSGGHPAAKARNRSQGLAESGSFLSR